MSSQQNDNDKMFNAILALVIVTALGSIVAGVLTLGEPLEQPQGEKLVSLQDAPPGTVARSFLFSVRLSHWDAAYELLAEDVRTAVSYELFEKAVTDWMNQGQNAWGLKYREVGEPLLEGRTALVVVKSLNSGARESDWEWRLVRGESGWKISAVSGGPSIGSL